MYLRFPNFGNLKKYLGGELMSAFVLKIIACITMFIDHIGYVIFDGTSYFNYIGRIAFPIFAFQIAQGYVHTRNVKKYLIRLLIFAFLSQFPFMLFYSIISNDFTVNVIFTLLFGLFGIIVYDKTNKILGILITISIGIIAQICHFDYGLYGVISVLLFYIFRNRKVLLILAFDIATLINYLFRIIYSISEYGKQYADYFLDFYFPLCICTILSSIFIYLYNGKKGHDSKYLLYLFYPLHLLLIYMLSTI